jgi:hypothetical protein
LTSRGSSDSGEPAQTVAAPERIICYARAGLFPRANYFFRQRQFFENPKLQNQENQKTNLSELKMTLVRSARWNKRKQLGTTWRWSTRSAAHRPNNISQCHASSLMKRLILLCSRTTVRHLINLEPRRNNELQLARPLGGRKHTQVARRAPPYRLCIAAHSCAWRPFTPPYPKGGA